MHIVRVVAQVALIAALLGSPPAARAQQTQGEVQKSAEDATSRRTSVGLRGGLSGYTGALGGLVGIGTGWGVQIATRPSGLYGFEAAYRGSRNGIRDRRVQSGAAINRNGIEGLAKLYFRRQGLQPYLGVGIGLSYANPVGASDQLYTGSLFAELPLFAGVEYIKGILFAGGRLTYNPLVGAAFAAKAAATNPGGGFLELGAQVGLRF